MESPYFQTDGLTVGYRQQPLIRDICLSLQKGEILTLIGPNGAGKTTILKSIIRQLAPLGGAVYLGGNDLAGMNNSRLAKQMAVVLTQRVKTELMTCEEVVSTGRYPYTGKFGVLTQHDHAKVREAMELVHITELAQRDFEQISDGQKQRVLLARALCQEPEVLVLDEPTSFLDIRYKLEFLSVVQQLSRRQRLTVVMSLHEVDLAQRISHKLACIKGDRVERFGTPEEIFVPGYIESLYGVGVGDFDFHSGGLELEKPAGEPKVFVLGGNGTGTHVFRQLQRQGIPFAAGVLWTNDLDYPVARALAMDIVEQRAFSPLTEACLACAKHWIDTTEYTVCTLSPAEMSGQAEPLRELADYAQRQGKLRDGL